MVETNKELQLTWCCKSIGANTRESSWEGSTWYIFTHQRQQKKLTLFYATLQCRRCNIFKKIYISFLPSKSWKITLKSCSEKQPKKKNSCSKMWLIDQLYIELGHPPLEGTELFFACSSIKGRIWELEFSRISKTTWHWILSDYYVLSKFHELDSHFQLRFHWHKEV